MALALRFCNSGKGLARILLSNSRLKTTLSSQENKQIAECKESIYTQEHMQLKDSLRKVDIPAVIFGPIQVLYCW